MIDRFVDFSSSSDGFGCVTPFWFFDLQQTTCSVRVQIEEYPLWFAPGFMIDCWFVSTIDYCAGLD